VAVSAGTAYLDIAPRLGSRFSSQLGAQVGNPVASVGERSGRTFGQRFSKGASTTFKAVGAGLAAGLAGTLLAARGLKGAVDAASDLNETLSKSQVIFGKNAKTIQAWAKGSARSMGLSRNEALANASAFGDMFRQLGIGLPTAAGMSKQMVELSADLASFNNADISDVLNAQQSAFRGEYDALQRFIPNINAARVEQEALRLTHKESAKDLTAAEKAQATYSIMLRDSTRAQGDFKKTSGGLANQQRILSAQWQDLKATVGNAFLPAMISVTRVLNHKLLPAVGKLWRQYGPGIKQAVAAAAAAFQQAAPSAGQLSSAISGLGPILERIGPDLGAKVGETIGQLVTRFKELGPQLSQANLKGSDLAPTLHLAGAALGFLADHADVLARNLPLLVAAFVAYKGAQAAAQYADLARVALLPLQIAGNFAVARSVKALAAAQREAGAATVAGTAIQQAATGVTNTSVLALVRQKAAMVAQAIAAKAVAAASMVWRAAQIALNFVLAANPIGLVVVAIAGLIALIVLAYKKSDTFRRIVDTAFRAVVSAGQAMLDFLRPIFATLVQVFLDVAGKILDSAATAFGWVPGLGGKLKTAATKFNEFKTSVNESLDKVKNKNVTVKAEANIGWGDLKTFRSPSGRLMFAHGGLVQGPGTGTSDSIPARLSRGEFVVRAAAVKRVGIERLQRLNAQGFARGGLAGDAGDVPDRGVRITAQGSVGPLDQGVTVVNRRLTSIADNLATFLKKTAQTLGVTGRVGRAIKFAMAQLGEPYLWGGTGPDRWDCSGLMLRAFQAAGIRLPRVSRDQARAGVGVPGLGAALPGDMLFYGSPVHHVGMYLGRGRKIHAPHTGAVVSVNGVGSPVAIRRVIPHDRGGIIREPTLMVGLRSGQLGTMAERRPEAITPLGGGRSATVNVYPRQLAPMDSRDLARALRRVIGVYA
jgi:cell wall-associated NlpC family hydrolase